MIFPMKFMMVCTAVFLAKLVLIGNLEGPLDDKLFAILDKEIYHKLEDFAMKNENVEDFILASQFEAAYPCLCLDVSRK